VLVAAGCDPIIAVVPSGFEDTAKKMLPKASVVTGGSVRADSVRKGLEHARTDHVVVHDAVRPFATPAMVRAVLAALVDVPGAMVAVPVEETINQVHGGRVASTVDRSSLWRAQTPQAFVTEALRRAHQRFGSLDVTDDAQLIEADGGQVAVVEGSRLNIKLTYPEDFALAEAMLSSGLEVTRE
jgi:2-C-methyl-D-erythritol 4-phosphate cytidylyltransferase / 2-C-methyl-D-erythritol 2,4-cyclodiphosphate synthase